MILSRLKAELALLERHMKILRLLGERPLGIMKLSAITGIPPHQVRYSLRVLQQSGFLEPTTKGAVLNGRARNFIAGIKTKKRFLIGKISSI